MNPLTPSTAIGEPSVLVTLRPDPLVRTARLSD
jgi:hypothetical protein